MFSQYVIQYPLYPYQVRWAQYVLDVINDRRPETVVVVMPRQSGKNETSAQLEVAVLARWAKMGGEIVKTAPTFLPQIANSKMRFDMRSSQARQRAHWLKFRPVLGYQFRLHNSGISFLSADKKSNVVGATASLLLEVDEAQDIDQAKFDKEFSPMRASTNAPLVAYGTTWTDDTLLEIFCRDIEEGRTPGKVFRIYPEEVAQDNPAYGEFVDREVARLGRDHPSIRTQYFLEMLANRGRLLTPQQLDLLMGSHGNWHERPDSARQVVAGLDWAGADEGAGALSTEEFTSRDSVFLTIASVEWANPIEGVWEPDMKILARYEWVNVHPLSLHSTLYHLLQERWRVNRVHSDGTGIGATGTAFLQKAMDPGESGRITAVTFDSAWNTHTRLASQYVGAINGARLQDYKVDFDPIAEAGKPTTDKENVDKHIWWQRGHARLEAKPSQRYRAYVPSAEGHDDGLISEMLMVDAAMQMKPAQTFDQAKPVLITTRVRTHGHTRNSGSGKRNRR